MQEVERLIRRDDRGELLALRDRLLAEVHRRTFTAAEANAVSALLARINRALTGGAVALSDGDTLPARLDRAREALEVARTPPAASSSVRARATEVRRHMEASR